MLFWPVVAAALAAVIVMRLDAAFPGALREENAAGSLIYLLLFLALILFFGFRRRRRVRLGRAALMAAGWFAAFAALLVVYSFREEARAVVDRVRGEISPTVAILNEAGEAELRKTRDGHFRASARVNGAAVDMLVDTGASIVLLSYEDAAAIGLEPERLAFTQPVTTANGRTFVAPITLEHVSIGPVGLSRVRAAVAAEGKVGTSLLGMSFLGRLAETSFRGDRLILRN